MIRRFLYRLANWLLTYAYEKKLQSIDQYIRSLDKAFAVHKLRLNGLKQDFPYGSERLILQQIELDGRRGENRYRAAALRFNEVKCSSVSIRTKVRELLFIEQELQASFDEAMENMQ